jgi:DNA-binding NtrC family response regulator
LLPRATETADLRVPLTEAGPVAETTSAHILFVEDDAEVAGVTAELLEDIGYRPVEARDGDSALAALERDPKIALVLSDIVMPGRMSGLELARILSKLRPELPFLLATGYSQYVSPAAGEGFVLVEKPYRRDVLGALIRKALERGRREHIG